MNLVESRSPNGGTLILRHRAYDLDDYSLDQRHCMLAVEVEGRCTVDEGLGHYKYDPVTVGDFPNPHRWQRSAEDSIPSGWSWAWPVLTIEQSGGAGGGGAPTVTAGIVISDPSGSGSRRVGGSATSTSAQPRRKDAEVLPIKDAPYSLDDRFEKLKPGQLSDDHHVWPKFPVNYVGIVLATSDEAQQVSTFHPTDPRLIAVNKAGDPYTGTLVCDTDGEFRVDKERTAKLHSMMRVLKKPLKGENAVAWNIVKSGMGDAFGGLVFDGKVGASVHVSQGGPFDCGLDADQHQLDKDGDGNPINSLHLSTGALFLVAGNVAYDGPLDFEQDKYPEADTGPKKMKVHLVWDSEATHQHPSGLKRGKWRWYAEATSSVVPAPCAPRTPTGGGPGRGPTGGGGGSPPVRTPDTGRVGTGVAGGSDGGPSIPPTVSTPGGGSPGGMSPAQPPTYDGYNLGAGHVPSEPSELPPYEPGAYSPSEPVDTGGFQPGLYPGEGDPADRIRGEVYRPGEGVFGPQYGPIEDLLNQPPTQGETTLGGDGRSMVENTMETSFPSINFRSPADVGDGMYDITHDPYPSEVDLANFQNNAPVTMRAEGYARQQTAAVSGGGCCGAGPPTGGPPAYTNPPCSGIYQGGTSDGGVALTPGDLTAGDAWYSYVDTDPDAPVMSNMMSVSKVFWALTPGVFLGFGEADRISGGIKNGYSCRVKVSAAQWYTHDSGGAKSEAIRFYSTQQIGWRNATNFYGKLAHAITANREWWFPNLSQYVALNQWTLGLITAARVPYGAADGSLTQHDSLQYAYGGTPATATLTLGSTVHIGNLKLGDGVAHYVTLRPGTMAADGSYTWPTALPAGNGYVLSSLTTGVMSWTHLATVSVTSLTGTADQVLVNGTVGVATVGACTLTLPQSIATSSTPQFTGLLLQAASPVLTWANTDASAPTYAWTLAAGASPTLTLAGNAASAGSVTFDMSAVGANYVYFKSGIHGSNQLYGFDGTDYTWELLSDWSTDHWNLQFGGASALTTYMGILVGGSTILALTSSNMQVNGTLSASGAVTLSALTGPSLLCITAGEVVATDTTALTPQFLRGGFGVAAHATVPLYALATTEQARFAYSAAVYTSFTTNSNGYLAISPTGGNVGIGTTVPGYPLDVNGTTGNLGLIHAKQTDSQYTQFLAESSGGNKAFLGVGGAAGAFGTYSNIPLAFYTNYSEKMRIDTAGNVGIGVLAPAAKLEVLSTTEQIRASYDVSHYFSTKVDANGYVTLSPTGGVIKITDTHSIRTATAATGTIYMGSHNWYFRDSGNGYANVLSLSHGVVINEDGDATYDLRVQGDTDENLFITDASADRVGIGVAAPLAKLDVLAVTEQIRASYSAAVYASHTVASTGVYTITQTGTYLALSKAVNVGTSALATGVGDFASGLTASYQVAFAQAAGTLALHSAAASVVHTIHANGETAFNMLHGASLDFRVAGESLDRIIGTDASTATENLALLADALPNWQTMDRGMFVGDCTTAPTGNPSAGGFLYSVSGALTWRGSSGTITTIAPAEPHCPKCGWDFMHEWENEKYGYLAICMNCLSNEIGDRPWILRSKQRVA